MLRSGVLTGATLKAAIKVIDVDDESESEDEEDADEEAQPQNVKQGTTPGELPMPSEDGEEDEKNEEDKELGLLKSKYNNQI